MSTGHIIWHFEGPVNLTATETATLTWQTNTFNTASFGNFSCNVWLLRADALSDVQVLEYDPVLLAGNQNVYNNSFQWTPAESDIDIGVPHAGSHQLAWERTQDNPKFQVNLTTDFKGFSKGFNVLPVNFSETTTTSSSSASTPSATSATSLATASASTSNTGAASSGGSVSQGTAIGLGVAFGCLALFVLSGGIWWYAARYRKRREAGSESREAKLPTPPPYKEELDGRSVSVWRAPEIRPVELDSGVEMPRPQLP